jgi:hypothetical protein
MRGHVMQRHAAGNGALGIARGHVGHDLGKPGQHRHPAYSADEIGLRGRGNTDAPPTQLRQIAQRLRAKNDLRRIDVEGQRLNTVLFAQRLLQVRPEGGDGLFQTGHVRVEPGQVRRVELRVLGRQGAQRRRSKWHDA